MKTIQIIGWFLSYFQLIVIVPFGTCTQGNDDPWMASLFYSVIPLIGLILLLITSNKVKNSLLGLPHAFTLLIILWNTPSYWIRATFKGQHICAGFHKDYVAEFEPVLWHRIWAPYVTIIGLTFFLIGLFHCINFIKSHRKKVSSGSQNRASNDANIKI